MGIAESSSGLYSWIIGSGFIDNGNIDMKRLPCHPPLPSSATMLTYSLALAAATLHQFPG